MLRLLFISLSLLFFIQTVLADEITKTLRFGVLSFRPKDITTAQWQPLAKELEKNLVGYHVELLPLTYPELDKAAKEKQVDLILTNPEHYILLKNKLVTNAVATLIALDQGHPTAEFAGVIFTRADREDIKTLADLDHKVIASPSENSLGGYLMQRWELEKEQIKAKSYVFTGMPHDNAVNEVLAGKADAGFVRSGVLESLEKAGKLKLHDNATIKIIAPHEIDTDLTRKIHSVHSTNHYPEWAVSVSRHINPELTRKISLTLLSIQADSNIAKAAGIAGFNSPADYTPVEVLMLRLRTHPDELKYFDFEDVIWRYRFLAFMAVIVSVLITTLVIILIRTNKRLKNLVDENKTLSLAVEQSSIAIVITDANVRIQYVNTAFTKHTGYELEEVKGKNPKMLASGKTEKWIFDKMWEALRNGKSYRCEMINCRKNGSEYTELAVITPIRSDDGVITHYLAIKEDISERKKIEKEIQETAQYTRLLIETSLDPLVTISAEGKITDVNTATEKVTGVDREQLIGSDFATYFTDPQKAREGYQKAFLNGTVTEYALAIQHTSGCVTDVIYNASVYRNIEGKVQGVFAAARDVTERKKAENEIKQLAFFDPLTNLPNRRKLLDRLHYSIALSHRENQKFAVFMMDLDKFKIVNDKLGHAAGDDLLKQVAVRVPSCLRESDMMARLGGDEFVIVLEHIEATCDAAQIATKVIANLTRPFVLSSGESVEIGASIGISFYPQHGDNAEKLIDNADTALYRAKDNGRGCFAYYEN